MFRVKFCLGNGSQVDELRSGRVEAPARIRSSFAVGGGNLDDLPRVHHDMVCDVRDGGDPSSSGQINV